jgi:hypothetical protein
MGRTIHQGDAILWLKNQTILNGCSIVTSMPDISEFQGFTTDQWKTWFQETARLIFSKSAPEGLAIFYQTDIFRDGEWIDKGFLIQEAAKISNVKMVLHKIVCRAPAGEASFGRPGYSHMLAFSKSVQPQISKSLPDVLPTAGETTWTRGMGLDACRMACRLILEHTSTRVVLDPFCGHGGVLAVAESLGMDAIGIELNAKRARRARTLNLETEGVKSMEMEEQL